MRLYWEQPYTSEFEARVVRTWTEGGKHYVVLDQTLFYPAAGGQACDTGSLNDIAVLEVIEGDPAIGEITHVVASPLQPGQQVQGCLDWAARYRQMQRHTAEHILAQAFRRGAGWETLAVNMGSPVCTIDFSGAPDENSIRQGEALANWAVYANTPVETFLIAESEIRSYPLRRFPKAAGQIRVVEIKDWDMVACGGIHVARSGEAGPIKIIKYERYKGGTRVYFMAGWEALETFSAEHALLTRLGERFSSGINELEKPISNLRDEWHRVRAENNTLKDELAERIVRELLAEFPGLTIQAQVPNTVLDLVGKRLAEWPGVLALLVAQAENRVRYVLLKHSSRSEDLQVVWDEVLRPLGARGGGALVKVGVLPLAALHPVLAAYKKYLLLR